MPKIRQRIKETLVLLIGDQIVLWSAFFFAFWLKYNSGWPSTSAASDLVLGNYLGAGLVLSGYWLILFVIFGQYWRRAHSFLSEVLRLNNAISFGVLVLLLATFDIASPLSEVRVVLLGYWALLLVGLWVFRWGYWKFARPPLFSGFPSMPTEAALIRRLSIIIVDGILITFSLYFAFFLRFEGKIPRLELAQFFYLLPLVIIIRFSAFSLAGLYSGLHCYASFADLFAVLKGVTFGSALLVAPILINWLVNHIDPALVHTLGLNILGNFFPRMHGYPRSVFFIDWLLMVVLVGGFRFTLRAVRELVPNLLRDGRRCLIVGAGDAGEMLIREIRKSRNLPYLPVGFIDDNPDKRGLRIHGIAVLGDRQEIPQLVKRYNVEVIIVAIPSATGVQMRRIVDSCQKSKVTIETLPPLRDILGGNVSVGQVRRIRLEDLLGREPVQLDTAAISSFIAGQRILITGAGGSIGSELVRQVLRFAPDRILALDRVENNLYDLEQELRRQNRDQELTCIIADVCDREKMQSVFALYQPQVVFHTAAYKHVPLMEENPDEAVKNNVVGTIVAADLSEQWGVSKFVLISTDKAVDPSSVMGATKRVAELYLQDKPTSNRTQFVTVRFGNVLGSEGSVIPLFQKQIAQGGPVTVTDPEATRYFMTIPEAALLVLQASAIGKAHDIMLLDMGEPIKIIDLARDLITLSGYLPDQEIPIVFTGLRKGEKLEEQLFQADEDRQPTSYTQIMVARSRLHSNDRLSLQINCLIDKAQRGDSPAVIQLLKEIVPSYVPGNQATKKKSVLEEKVAVPTR